MIKTNYLKKKKKKKKKKTKMTNLSICKGTHTSQMINVATVMQGALFIKSLLSLN